MSIPSITEPDLHAYADGQLQPARRAQVEAYLAAHPDAAAQVHEMRMQNDLLHTAFDGVLNEPVPAHLVQAAQPQRQWLHWQAMAAGLACLVCGLAGGWFGHMLMTERAETASAFARNALAAHVVYAAEQRHPVEVPAAQEAHLVAWLSKRLDAPVRAPDLRAQGFSLLGGRLLPGRDKQPLAQLMYESAAGERLTLTVRHARGTEEETGFRILQQDGVSAFYWIDRDYGYALSGALAKERLLAVAHAVERQLR